MGRGPVGMTGHELHFTVSVEDADRLSPWVLYVRGSHALGGASTQGE